MKLVTRAAFFLGVVLLPVSGIAQTDGKQAAPQAQAVVATTKVPQLTPEQLDEWTGKLNAYVNLYNRSSRAITSWNRYKSWVNVKTGPTGKERVVYGLYSTYDDVIKDLAPKAVAAAREEPKAGALDKAVTDYAAALEKLDPILREAYNYYNRKDYTDDKFARGKELHPQLVEAFEAVAATRATFDTELTSVKAQIDEQTLAHIEKTEGRKYRWHMKRIMMASLKAIEAVQAVESKQDLPAFSEAVKTYAGIVHEFDDYVTNAGDLPTSFSIKGRPDSILSNLREARDALEKGNNSSFTRAANSAVSDYNTMVSFAR